MPPAAKWRSAPRAQTMLATSTLRVDPAKGTFSQLCKNSKALFTVQAKGFMPKVCTIMRKFSTFLQEDIDSDACVTVRTSTYVRSSMWFWQKCYFSFSFIHCCSTFVNHNCHLFWPLFLPLWLFKNFSQLSGVQGKVVQ